SGNPPRHSKSADEPVTIDLDAQEFSAAADTEKPVDNETGDADSTTADVGLAPETGTASHAEHEGRFWSCRFLLRRIHHRLLFMFG
ncbi:hypothetical protein AB9F35_34865, partial [Rhizobium leguminosarum]